MYQQSNHYNEASKPRNTILSKSGQLVDGVSTGASAFGFSVNKTKYAKGVQMM